MYTEKLHFERERISFLLLNNDPFNYSTKKPHRHADGLDCAALYVKVITVPTLTLAKAIIQLIALSVTVLARM